MSHSNLESQPLLINDPNKALDYQRATNSKSRGTSCGYMRCCVFGLIGSIFLFFIATIILLSTYINNQVHLSFTNYNTNNITATWIGYKDYNKGDVSLEYFNTNSPYSKTIVNPNTSIFNEAFDIDRYVYRAEFSSLDYNSSYNYYINFRDSQYGPFDFFVKEKNKYENKVLFIGDMDLFYGQLRQVLLDRAIENYDFIFHLGDIVYNLNAFFGFMGDIYLSLLEPITSHIPYMTIPGNHEEMNNFSNYINRFTMPNYKQTDNLYYTIERPPLKMINFNTEAYYFSSMQPTLESQTNFIINELNNTNRTQFPWLITTGYRPMYFANNHND